MATSRTTRNGGSTRRRLLMSIALLGLGGLGAVAFTPGNSAHAAATLRDKGWYMVCQHRDHALLVDEYCSDYAEGFAAAQAHRQANPGHAPIVMTGEYHSEWIRGQR